MITALLCSQVCCVENSATVLRTTLTQLSVWSGKLSFDPQVYI